MNFTVHQERAKSQEKIEYIPAESGAHATDTNMNQISPTKTPNATANDSHMVGKFTPVTGSASQNNSGQTYRAGENGVTMPKCEFCPKPEYSPEARDANLQGTVYLQVVVLSTGFAGDIKVIRGFEESLDQQAIKVIRERWTFKPGTDRNGNPVNVTVPVEIVFQLFGPPQPPPQSTGRPAATSSATERLTSNESLQAKIFTGPVTNNGASTPSYMGSVNTQTISAPKPELPRLARQTHVQGPVTLNLVVNTEGKVIVVEYVKGPAMLAQSAISTVRDWIIKGTHDGVPVTFQISVEVSFNEK